MDTYEKKYKESLELARDYYKANLKLDKADENLILEDIFPELEESKDERIRKLLISGMKNLNYNAETFASIPIKDVIDWLEKQGKKETLCDKCRKEHPSHSCQDITALGRCALEKQDEQKPAWSEEGMNKPNGGIVMEDFNDGNGFYKVNLAYLNEEQVEQIEELVKRWGLQPKRDEDESIISDLLDYFDEDKCLKHEVNDIIKWLKTIKPQQKGWGENEIKMLDNLITYLDGRKDLLEEIKSTYIGWLKSLKERYTWKPSNEQMKALHDLNLTGNISYAGQGQILIELYNDLKKLTE